MGGIVIKVGLDEIPKDFDLRSDSKFYSQIKSQGFRIVEKSKYPFIKLMNILIPKYENFNFELGKKYKALETSAEYFDEEGNIIDFLEVTEENKPKRIKYSASENQIVISSIKGAKASTILVTKNKLGCAWSNGFYILENKNEIFETKFLYYLLKSKLLRKILDRNLSRGIGISSYKERDLLRIEIPLVPKDIQKETIKTISEIEREISEIKNSIPNLQNLIRKTFEEEFGCFSKIIEKKTTIFKKNFSMISKRFHLRCDPKYFIVFDKTNWNLFTNGNCNYHKLFRLIELYHPEILHKGEFTREYILIDKKQVEPKTGIILEENFTNRIESNKIVFGDADILISKLRTYLGHVFLNQKRKPLIGTPEFLPYIVNKREVLLEYLLYIFLSENFLNLISYLQTGKEHPRISDYDLRSIKIPLPKEYTNSITKQKMIVKNIQEKTGNLIEKKKQLREKRLKIETILFNVLKG